MLALGNYRSLGEALREQTLPFRSNVALIEANRTRESGRWTFGQVHAAAARVGGWLQAHGFAPGDRCAILLSNQSRWPISATGAFWAGAVLVPLDYKLTAPEQIALLRHARPRALVTEWPIWRTLRTQAPDVLEAMSVLVTDVPDGESAAPGLRWDDVPDAPLSFVDRDRDDTACIVYSSGTGGTPKGCQLTHHNYLSQAEALGGLFPMEESDRYFSILPTNHAIDFMCGYLMPFLFGGAVVHQRTLRAEFLTWTMKEYGVTHMALVPRILKLLEEKIRERIDELEGWRKIAFEGLVALNEHATWREPRHAVSSRLLRPIHDAFGGRLRYVFCGGAFVEKETAEFFHRLGIPVAIGYGLTEAGTVLTLNDLKPFRGDTVGRPIPGVELRIAHLDERGVGEVLVRGPTVMKGYVDEPELTREAIVDGWLCTGDLGWIDPSGHLRLVGRAKNMIVTEGGKNIHPEDIENAFDGINDCEEHCAFAANYIWRAHTMVGEKLVVVVRPKAGASVEALVRAIGDRNRRLAEHRRVDGVLVWNEEFPRTASFKIRRNVLAAQIAAAIGRDAMQEFGS